jgi:hypothetical protein
MRTVLCALNKKTTKRRNRMRIRVFIIMLIFFLAPVVYAQVTGSTCDRKCLEGYIERYMDAMLDNNPSLELFSRDCKFTENGVRLPLGNEGLWVNMSKKGTYKFYIPDIETQQIAFLGTAYEGGGNGDGKAQLVGLAIRLKIVNKLITEAEQLVIRPASDTMGLTGKATVGELVEKMGATHKNFTEPIPEKERASEKNL